MPEETRDHGRLTHRSNGKPATARRWVAVADRRCELSGQSELLVEPQAPGDPSAGDADDRRPVRANALAGGDTQTAAAVSARPGDRAEPALRGRRREGHALALLLEGVRTGHARALVLRGESGVGKSALLNHFAATASDCRVVRAAGVESELELPYAGLHHLCTPMRELHECLPAPQGDALATTFGLSAGAAPDPFHVGLAALTLFAAAAEKQPLVCIVDDAQWLDPASTQILGFVARRLVAERVAIVCAAGACPDDHVLSGLPELHVAGLDDGEARALLLDNVHGPLDAAICDRIVTESRGNPRALLELPRTRKVAELAGGFGLPDSGPVNDEIEKRYARDLSQLPSDTQMLVVVAAAEPTGNPVLLNRAAETLGLDIGAANPAVDAGLLKIGACVEFSRPLLRSAAYRTAAADDRQRVHRALAEATDPETDPDRCAWHRAHGEPGPDEHVAVELERSAGRAQGRGGVAAAAAFLRRAVELTVEPARRGERALAAAQASLQTGAFDAALGLAATAETAPLDECRRARVDSLRANVAFSEGDWSDAPHLLLQAAQRLEPCDVDLARETYLTAWGAASIADDVGGGDVASEISRAVQAVPSPSSASRPHDLALDGLALLSAEGPAAATATLQRAAKALADIPAADALRWGWAATGISAAVWDDEGFHAIAARQVELVREAGALGALPISLSTLALAKTGVGDFAGALALVAESDSVAAATGNRIPPYALLRLRALQGAEASPAMAGAVEQTHPQAYWAAAVLYNGLGRYEEAASAARQATPSIFDPWGSMWALPELVEATVRAGDAELARDALERLARTTQPCRTEFALGIEARCRALLSDGAAAEELYREAIERLSRTRLRPELARAHLLYGEWLRRQKRRVDAREQLRNANAMFVAIGMEAFAERARVELQATGEKVRKRTAETRDDLTAQERQISSLARDGLSNPEIAARLFLSPRTIEWHLRNVYMKLDIRSRRDLAKALGSPDPQLIPA